MNASPCFFLFLPREGGEHRGTRERVSLSSVFSVPDLQYNYEMTSSDEYFTLNCEKHHKYDT